MKCLGLPFGAVFGAKFILDTIIVKMEKRLAWWKILYLSKGGRVLLIMNILSNRPTRFLSLFPISIGAVNRLEKLQWDFLWEWFG